MGSVNAALPGGPPLPLLLRPGMDARGTGTCGSSKLPALAWNEAVLAGDMAGGMNRLLLLVPAGVLPCTLVMAAPLPAAAAVAGCGAEPGALRLCCVLPDAAAAAAPGAADAE